MFVPLSLPRPFSASEALEAYGDALSQASTDGHWPVLCTTAWPNNELSNLWTSELARMVSVAGSSHPFPLILADLPTLTFNQLRTGPFRTGAVLRDVCGRKHDPDRLVRGDDKNRLSKQLRRAGELACSALVSKLAIRPAGDHFELPSGIHTNVNVVLGDLSVRDGGDGLEHLLCGLMVRRLAGRGAVAAVYWAADSHRTMPSLVLKVEELTRLVRTAPIEVFRLSGGYDSPRLTRDDARRLCALGSTGPVIVLVDVSATGKLEARNIDVLVAGGVSPHALAVGAFVGFEFAPIRTGKPFPYVRGNRLTPIPTFRIATVSADKWDREACPRCKAGHMPDRVHSEARPQHSFVSWESYQPSLATVWSAIITQGRVGRRAREPDYRHLHDRYLEPGQDHVHALMSGIIRELGPIELDAVVCRQPSVTSSKIDASLRYAVGSHVPSISARKTSGAWAFTEDALPPPHARVAFVDDGVNSGTSLLTALEALRAYNLYPHLVIVFEDKAPPGVRRGLEAAVAAASVSSRGRAGRLFSIHRSPPTELEFLDNGRCRRCREREMFQVLANSTSVSDRVCRAAAAMSSDEVWGPEIPARLRDEPLLEVSLNVPAGEQLDRLFTHYADIVLGNPHLMLVIIDDVLPHLRQQDLVRQLAMLDPRWLQHVAIHLDPEEFQEVDERLGERMSDRLLVSLVARLRWRRGSQEMGDLLAELAKAEQRNPEATERWANKAIQNLVRGVTSARGKRIHRPLFREAERQSASGLADELLAVLEVAQVRQKGTGTASFAVLDPSTRELHDDPPNDFLAELATSAWVLDLTRHELWWNGEKHHDLDPAEAILLAAAAVRRRIHTRDATRLIRQFFPDSPRRVQRSVEKFWGRVERQKRDRPDYPFASTTGPPRRTSSADEKCIKATDEPLVLLWDPGAETPTARCMSDEVIMAAIPGSNGKNGGIQAPA